MEKSTALPQHLDNHNLVTRFRGGQTFTLRGQWARRRNWVECPECGGMLDGHGRCVARCHYRELDN